jgi:hypothetical protein
LNGRISATWRRDRLPAVFALICLLALCVLGDGAHARSRDDTAAGGTAGEAEAAPGNHPAIVPGERLTFSVRFGMVKAGTATLELSGPKAAGDRSGYQIVSTAVSNSVFDKIYPVRDRIISLMDTRTLEALYFEKHLREGKYKADQSIRFDQEQALAVYHDGKTVPIVKGCSDVLSAFYRVRTMPLVPGQELTLDSHADRKNYAIRVIVQGREELDSILGPVSCLVVEPELKSGAFFKNEGKLTIYLTDDDRRIPVLMRSKIPVGSISVVLTSMERPGSGAAVHGDVEPGQP